MYLGAYKVFSYRNTPRTGDVSANVDFLAPKAVSVSIQRHNANPTREDTMTRYNALKAQGLTYSQITTVMQREGLYSNGRFAGGI